MRKQFASLSLEGHNDYTLIFIITKDWQFYIIVLWNSTFKINKPNIYLKWSSLLKPKAYLHLPPYRLLKRFQTQGAILVKMAIGAWGELGGGDWRRGGCGERGVNSLSWSNPQIGLVPKIFNIICKRFIYLFFINFCVVRHSYPVGNAGNNLFTFGLPVLCLHNRQESVTYFKWNVQRRRLYSEWVCCFFPDGPKATPLPARTLPSTPPPPPPPPPQTSRWVSTVAGRLGGEGNPSVECFNTTEVDQ